VTPLIFVALSSWMVSRAFAERPVSSLAGAATIAASLLLYLLVARSRAVQPNPVLE
jgi:hypothetical protein